MLQLKGFKYRVADHFISRTQEDGEEVTPEVLMKVRYPGAMPNILTIKKSDAAQLKARKDKAKTDGESDSGTSGNKGKQPSGGTKHCKSSSKWLSLINKKHAGKHKDNGPGSSKNKALMLGKGNYVYTRDKQIAPKSIVSHPSGTRCYHLKYRGTIVKPSKYYDKIWLVKFNDGKIYACT